jgi:hypothetical protein
MKALYIKTDRTIQTVEPENGKSFALKELQQYVGGAGVLGMVDIQNLPDGRTIYLNDNGKIEGLDKNEIATEIWKRAYPIDEYPENNDELMVGNILLLEKTDEELQNIFAELELEND